MMQYVHCLHNINNQSTAICRQIIRIDIAAKYSVTILFITDRHQYAFYCKYNAQKSSMELVWKYGRLSSIPFLKSSIPFHSGIFHIPYHNFRSIPYHALLVTYSTSNTTLLSLHQYKAVNSNVCLST